MIFSVQAKIDEKGINIEVLDAGFVESFRKAVGGLAKATQAEWIRLAQDKLKTSRDDYINGLRQAESFQSKSIGTTDVHEIQLVGKMANNFEFGMPSFDMKAVRPGWLGGDKAKTGKDGKKYVVIPFRHSTGTSARLGYTGKAARANLKTELKRVVKEYGLDKMIRTATGRVKEGPVTRVPKSSDVHNYLHGLVRIQKGVSGTTSSGMQRGQSQLMTFRIMSENSKSDSWWQPEKAGANLLPEVEKYVDNELDNIIDLIMGGS